VCQPGTAAFKVCPVRENTALWLIDNDSDIYRDAQRDVYSRIRFWFADDFEYYDVVADYVDIKIDEMCEGYVNDLSAEDEAEYTKFMDDDDKTTALQWVMYNMARRGLDDEFHQLFVWNQRKHQSKCKKREEFNRHCIEKAKKELNALLLKTEIVIHHL
jgi:hypothetical protein